MDGNLGSDLVGPFGGAIAIAFATGCVSTWGFMERIVYRERVRNLDLRIAFLEAKAAEYDKLMKGFADAHLAQLDRKHAS